jgi:choline dehydrogenase-like flavoprotein
MLNCDDLNNTIDTNQLLETDLVIIGGGPASYSIAREFAGGTVKVLVLESGVLTEQPPYIELNRNEKISEPRTAAQVERRTEFHGAQSQSWSNDVQPYGVRNRVLGGSSLTWAGKSAAFAPIDFEKRAWAPYSGWPFDRQSLPPFLDRAAELLNLGPNCYDEQLWELMSTKRIEPQLDKKVLRSFFWQFARSRIDMMDVTRFGAEFQRLEASNVRVLLNATVTHINTDPDTGAFDSLEVSTIEGRRAKVKAAAAVLAAGGIENPRLLLASNRIHAEGVGNKYDMVGRFLMDHAGARIGHFRLDDIGKINDRFGFYGVRGRERWHMYMHGLVLSDEIQAEEQLLNCALYMMQQRAMDDPWDAVKRLLKRRSERPLEDVRAILSNFDLLFTGVGNLVLSQRVIPKALKERAVNTMIHWFPNLVVREHLRRGLPHKIERLDIDAISEQRPDPDSRIMLSERRDRFGVPLPLVDWRIGLHERVSVIRLAHHLRDELQRVGLPAPVLEDWVAENRPEDGVFIDTAHPCGTTRMAEDPREGVVYPQCRVHGVERLYIAGGSVFPTSSHVNPTLMIMALAIRLADQIKADMGEKFKAAETVAQPGAARRLQPEHATE